MGKEEDRSAAVQEFIVGISTHPEADVELIQEAGIGWVRSHFPFPFEDRLYGSVGEEYRRAKKQAERWIEQGLRVMGTTPEAGIATRRPDASGRLTRTWHRHAPEWCGELGSEEFVRNYEGVCAWLARDLQGITSLWQIANELDHPTFAGPLSPRQVCELIEAGARGLRAGDPVPLLGQNPAGTEPTSYYLIGRLSGTAHSELDYCGIDGYPGTWEAGGPEFWADRIAELHDLTGQPVLVNEWGFSSKGEVMTEEEAGSGAYPCELRKWAHTWGDGHTPEGQAEFVRQAFDAFRSQREHFIGAFFYRWEDDERCYPCGSPDCPTETRWGLVDLEGRPKPAYYAFKEGVERLLS